VPLSVVLLTSAPAWRGSGTSLAKIAAGLERAGHRAVILAGPEDVCARFAATGVRVRQMPLARTGWREARLVSTALRAEGANVVLADMTRDLRLAALATFFRPVPLVFRYNLSRRVLEGHAFSRFLFRRVGAITFQSGYARDRALVTSPWLASWPNEILPNGYDGDRYRPDPASGHAFRRRFSIADDRPVVLSGAALFLDKGYELAIEAMRLVTATHSVEYVVAGAGDDAARIKFLAERAGIQVRFTGQLTQEEWFAALNGADLVLHPTPGELFPNIVAEAMLLGRPLVALDSGATPELLGGDAGAGVLVGDVDAQAMAGAIRSLLDDPAQRQSLGAAARERITGEFPLERMERGYVRLIEKLAGVSPSRPVRTPAGLPV
jgi:glycosyltransferase involved in cell wall biosynthesis